MAKFKFLVDHLRHPVMSSLILLWAIIIIIIIIIIFIIIIIIINSFVCHDSLGISASHLDLSKNSLHKTYTLLIQYLYTDQIPFSNSFDSSQKCPLKFFFLPFFLKSFHFFDTIGIFDLIKQFILKIYYSISKNIQLVIWLSFRNLP